MRLIAGRFGGRRLKSPQHQGLRPTAERVREALFNIIAPRPTGLRVLDLFAGVGALGLEALSRGARQAVFVERDRRAAALLQANIRALGLSGEEAEIMALPVLEALKILGARTPGFALIMADPPYEAGAAGSTLAALAGGRLLEPGGLIVFEHRASETIIPPQGLEVRDRRIYGDTGLTFLGRV